MKLVDKKPMFDTDFLTKHSIILSLNNNLRRLMLMITIFNKGYFTTSITIQKKNKLLLFYLFLYTVCNIHQ